jgi:hypothetical protein
MSRTLKLRGCYHPAAAIPVIMLAVLTPGRALADNILFDPGFESAAAGAAAGSTTLFTAGQALDHATGGPNWIVDQGTVGVDTENEFVLDGSKSVFLDAGSGPDSLSQTFSTVPGDLYEIMITAEANVPNTFSAEFGVDGPLVTDFPTSIGEGLVHAAGFASTEGNITSLILTATNLSGLVSGRVEIDDVVVMDTTASGPSGPGPSMPEPSTFALASIGVGLGFIVFRRRSLPPLG